MKLTANGTCTFCADLDRPMFRPFEKARDDLKDAASKVTEPATPILNAVLIGGLTAGLFAGAAFAWHKLRKKK